MSGVQTLSSDFLYKPSVYLSTHEERVLYKLYVSVQLEGGESLVQSPQFDGELMQEVHYNIVNSPDAPADTYVFQDIVHFTVAPNSAPDRPEITVVLIDQSDKRSNVIVHHADADIPGYEH